MTARQHRPGSAPARELGRLAVEDGEHLDLLIAEVIRHGIRQTEFGAGLADGCPDPEALWSRMVNELNALENPERHLGLHRGFLHALHDRDPAACNRILDEAMENKHLGSIFPDLQIAAVVDCSGIDRLRATLERRVAPAWAYGNLATARRSEGIEPAYLQELLLGIAALPDGVSVALDILHMRLYADRQEKRDYAPELMEVGRHLICEYPFEQCDGNNGRDYNLGKLAAACFRGAEGVEPSRKLMCRLLEMFERRTLYPYRCDNILTGLLKAQPSAMLDEMLDALGSDLDTLTEFFERASLERKNLADAIPDDVLLEWCYANPQVRFPAAARIVSLSTRSDQSSAVHWTAIALQLLDGSPDPAAVIGVFFARAMPHMWSGSLAAMMANHAELMGQLPLDRSAAVASAVRDGLVSLSKEIDAAQRWETMRERGSNESFE